MKRKIEIETSKAYNEILSQWQSPEIGNTSAIDILNLQNMSTNGIVPNIVRFPTAMPMNLIPYILKGKKISNEDFDLIKKEVFTSDLLKNVKMDYSAILVTIRGKSFNQTTNSVKAAYEIAKSRIESIPGLNERVQLLLLPEYRNFDPKNVLIEKYSGNKYEPIFFILSKDASPQPTQTIGYAFSAFAFLTTIASTFFFGVDVNSFNTDFMKQALAGDETTVNRVLVITIGILGTQLFHELGHFIAAKIHNVKLQLPFLIPSIEIGLFGSITNFISYPMNRKQLFDVSIAGPVLGFLVSLICSWFGIVETINATPEMLKTFPALPTAFFQTSYIFNEIAQNLFHILPATMNDLTAVTPVHPLFAIGMVGLLINALNFLPIGRLDGGRVAMSIGGRNTAAALTLITLIGEAFNLLSNTSPVILYFILYVVFLQRGQDLPPLDDITPISTEEEDNNKQPIWFARIFALMFCLAITSLILLPVPIDVQTTIKTILPTGTSI